MYSDGFSHTDKNNKEGIYIWAQVVIFQLFHISIPEDCFYLENSVDPDEMPHYAAFHLGLHCLSKYPFRGFKYTKGEPYISYIYFNNVLNLTAKGCCMFVIE